MPQNSSSLRLQQRTDASIAEQRERAVQYRRLAREATTEIMRKRLLDLARQCDAGEEPEDG
jgi:hypothetical protein